MPFRLNGTGTWYHGEENVLVHWATCEHCGAYAELRSYDTRKWIDVLFVPLIPLGRVRVLDRCGACTRHRTVRLADWEAAREDGVREALATYRADAASAEKAVAAIQTVVGFQDAGAFVSLARSIATTHGGDADVMELLGDAYEYFGRGDDAVAAYGKAIAARPDERLRRKRGLLLLRLGRPAEARSDLWSIVERADEGGLGLLYLLIEAYQAEGLHQDALQTIAEIERAFPHQAEDKELRRYRKRSEKNRGRGRPIRSKRLAPPGVPAASRRADGRVAAVVSGVFFVALLVAAGFFVADRLGPTPVYVVNGLDRPYTVVVGDEAIAVPARAWKKMEVPQDRELSVEVQGLDETIEPTTIRIERSFWDALFWTPTFVLNPDRTALLVWERTEYATTPDPNKELPYRLYVGKSFYRFDDIDYPFREFPEEITVSSSTTRVLRERIDHASGVSTLDAYAALAEKNGAETALGYLRRAVRLGENELAAFGVLLALVPPDEAKAIARRHLEAKPVEVEWHRLYQEVMERAGRTDELVAEYRARLAADPRDGDAAYLLARILPDPDEAERILLAAARGAPPSPYVFHGLAFQRLAEARFDDALALVRRARELDPDNDVFAYVESRALLALGRTDELVERTAAARAADPYAGDPVIEEVSLRAARGDAAGARAVIDAYLETLRGAVETAEDQVAVDRWARYLEAVEGHGRGDHRAFAEAMAALGDEEYLWNAAICAGQADRALELLDEELDDVSRDLLLYVVARRKGQRATAEAAAERALALLSSGTIEERTIARAFRGEVRFETVRRLSLEPDEKALAAAALWLRTGDARYRVLARRLAFGHDVAIVELRRWL